MRDNYEGLPLAALSLSERADAVDVIFAAAGRAKRLSHFCELVVATPKIGEKSIRSAMFPNLGPGMSHVRVMASRMKARLAILQSSSTGQEPVVFLTTRTYEFRVISKQDGWIELRDPSLDERVKRALSRGWTDNLDVITALAKHHPVKGFFRGRDESRVEFTPEEVLLSLARNIEVRPIPPASTEVAQ